MGFGDGGMRMRMVDFGVCISSVTETREVMERCKGGEGRFVYAASGRLEKSQGLWKDWRGGRVLAESQGVGWGGCCMRGLFGWFFGFCFFLRR